MIYINLCMYLFYNFVMGLFANLFMNRQKNVKAKVTNAFIWFIVMLVPSIIKYNLDETNPFFILLYYGGVIIYFVLSVCSFSQPLWKKLLLPVFILTIQTVGESILFAIYEAMGVFIELDYHTLDMTIFVIEDFLLVTLLLSIILYIQGIISKKFYEKISGIWTIVLLPFSTFMIMEKVTVLSLTQISNPIAVTIAYSISLIMYVALVIVVVRQNEKQRIINEIEEINARMEEGKRQIILLEKEYDKLSRVRHDKRNELALLVGLMEAGNIDEAKVVCERVMNESM